MAHTEAWRIAEDSTTHLTQCPSQYWFAYWSLFWRRSLVWTASIQGRRHNRPALDKRLRIVPPLIFPSLPFVLRAVSAAVRKWSLKCIVTMCRPFCEQSHRFVLHVAFHLRLCVAWKRARRWLFIAAWLSLKILATRFIEIPASTILLSALARSSIDRRGIFSWLVDFNWKAYYFSVLQKSTKECEDALLMGTLHNTCCKWKCDNNR